MREKEEVKRQSMGQVLANMSDGFFIYNESSDEKILYTNPPVLKLYECDTMEKFRRLIGNAFHGMVHPDDVKRVKAEIEQQIRQTDKKLDFIRYRIMTKTGKVRWVDDCGHLDSDSQADSRLFYVFMSDVTETITEEEKERLIQLSESY